MESKFKPGDKAYIEVKIDRDENNETYPVRACFIPYKSNWEGFTKDGRFSYSNPDVSLFTPSELLLKLKEEHGEKEISDLELDLLINDIVMSYLDSYNLRQSIETVLSQYEIKKKATR